MNSTRRFHFETIKSVAIGKLIFTTGQNTRSFAWTTTQSVSKKRPYDKWLYGRLLGFSKKKIHLHRQEIRYRLAIRVFL